MATGDIALQKAKPSAGHWSRVYSTSRETEIVATALRAPGCDPSHSTPRDGPDSIFEIPSRSCDSTPQRGVQGSLGVVKTLLREPQSQNRAWGKEPFQVQDRPMDFNVEHRKFLDKLSNTISQLTLKKLRLVGVLAQYQRAQ